MDEDSIEKNAFAGIDFADAIKGLKESYPKHCAGNIALFCAGGRFSEAWDELQKLEEFIMKEGIKYDAQSLHDMIASAPEEWRKIMNMEFS